MLTKGPTETLKYHPGLSSSIDTMLAVAERAPNAHKVEPVTSRAEGQQRLGEMLGKITRSEPAEARRIMRDEGTDLIESLMRFISQDPVRGIDIPRESLRRFFEKMSSMDSDGFAAKFCLGTVDALSRSSISDMAPIVMAKDSPIALHVRVMALSAMASSRATPRPILLVLRTTTDQSYWVKDLPKTRESYEAEGPLLLRDKVALNMAATANSIAEADHYQGSMTRRFARILEMPPLLALVEIESTLIPALREMEFDRRKAKVRHIMFDQEQIQKMFLLLGALHPLNANAEQLTDAAMLYILTNATATVRGKLLDFIQDASLEIDLEFRMRTIEKIAILRYLPSEYMPGLRSLSTETPWVSELCYGEIRRDPSRKMEIKEKYARYINRIAEIVHKTDLDYIVEAPYSLQRLDNQRRN